MNQEDGMNNWMIYGSSLIVKYIPKRWDDPPGAGIKSLKIFYTETAAPSNVKNREFDRPGVWQLRRKMKLMDQEARQHCQAPAFQYPK